MSPEIRDLVDRRWAEYGIESVPGAGNGGVGQTSRSLRQLLRRWRLGGRPIESRRDGRASRAAAAADAVARGFRDRRRGSPRRL